jgi:hypothetical protein
MINVAVPIIDCRQGLRYAHVIAWENRFRRRCFFCDETVHGQETVQLPSKNEPSCRFDMSELPPLLLSGFSPLFGFHGFGLNSRCST